MDVELQASCSSLGFLEGNEYIKEPDCLETVKDLIRFLRRDTDVCDIRRQLGHAQILQNDLIPLIKFYHKDKVLFDTVVKLMVNLTQPVIICFNNEIPDEKTLRNYCLEVEGYLQDYKEAFVSEDLFNVLAEKMQDILKLDWDERREEDKLQLERLFVLIRNVLMVPSNFEREQRTEDDASIHDQILWMMHTSGVEDLILYVASSDRERSLLCMHILEIIFLMFKEQEVNTIVTAGMQRSITEKEKDQKELEQARGKERAQRKASILKFSARHSRFGGTFIIKNMKSISENDVIYHKPLCDMETFSLDNGKVPKKVSKNRAPIKFEAAKRRSTLSMRLSLKEFCVQFLVNAYNPLMRAVKDALTRKTAQDNDETYYLWTMRFFMQFCRSHCKRVDLVSETMSLPAFHYIYTQLCTYYENIRLGKGEECKVWGSRAHLALKAYQELLHTLDFMCRSQNEKIRESAKIIQSNVFYMVEYRDIFVTLLKNFKESKCSRAYLRDLAESTHIFLKMLEGFLKSSRHLIVQKKKKQKRKPVKNISRDDSQSSGLTGEDLTALWDSQVSSELSTVLQNQPESNDAVIPFDAASDTDVEEQRVEAMLKIQLCLREQNLNEAVSLFRAAREVWPERDEFGSENMVVEEELIALHEIYVANLQRPQSRSQQNIEEEQEDVNEIIEEEREETLTCETEFDFKTFINDFAHQDLIKNYAILLEEFTTNSDHVNHCIVKMLHRISHDLGYVGMLFQASVFKTFNCLLQGHYAQLQKYQELTKFACYIVRQFTSIATINKRIFVDLMFWKSKSEALAITSDYDFNQRSKAKVLWTEHEEQELQTLFEKHRDAVHPELDVVDLILGELTSSHTRLQILRELKKQKLITSARDIKKKGTRPPKWTEDELQKVKDAFHMHCKSDYPISEIMKTLNTDKSKRVVIAKLIDLGMVHDKKQLLKQNQSRRKGSGRKHQDNSDEDEEMFAESDKSENSRQQDSNTDDDYQDVESDDDDDDERSDMQASDGQTAVAISDSVCNLIKKGYNRQLAWIIRGLRNAAEDRNDGVCVPIPLVPLSEENEIAMEDQIFLVFLRSIGITPPVSEQEMFWRIPGEYSSTDLSRIAECLELSMSGQAAAADDIHQIISRVFPNLSSQQSTARSSHDKKKIRREITGGNIKMKRQSKTKVPRGRLLNDENSTVNSQFSDKDDANLEIISKSCDGEPDRSDTSTSTVSVPARDGDTSDSGLDPEIEAREQERIRDEKQSTNDKKLKTEARRHSLMQMIKMKNEKKKTARPTRRRQEESVVANKLDGYSDDVDQPLNSEQEGNAIRLLDAESGSDASLSGASPTNERLDKPRKSRKPKSRSTSQRVSASSKKRLLESDSDSDASLSSVSPTNERLNKSEIHITSQGVSASAKKRMLESDSDSNDNHSNMREAKEYCEEGSNNRKLSKRFRFLSSDDDNDNEDNGNVLQKGLDESLKLHFSDNEAASDKDNDVLMEGKDLIGRRDTSENEPAGSFPATLFTQIMDSDDDDDHIPLRAAVRKRNAIIDDDDE